MKSPEELHAEAQNQRAAVAAPSIASTLVSAGISADTLEDVIKKILDERKAKVVEQFIPKEPDYKTLTEQDITRQDIYIPVIEHDIPDYMNVKLADDEYIPIWANRDQRRLGTLQAEGFELLKKEHLDPKWIAPLKFDSEGLYVYADVICMRVHKRIRFAKLRKFLEISKNQLKPAQAQENAKSTLMEKVILGDPALDAAFSSGQYKFYDTDT